MKDAAQNSHKKIVALKPSICLYFEGTYQF